MRFQLPAQCVLKSILTSLVTTLEESEITQYYPQAGNNAISFCLIRRFLSLKTATAELNTTPGLLRLSVPVQAHPRDAEVQFPIGLGGLEGAHRHHSPPRLPAQEDGLDGIRLHDSRNRRGALHGH